MKELKQILSEALRVSISNAQKENEPKKIVNLQQGDDIYIYIPGIHKNWGQCFINYRGKRNGTIHLLVTTEEGENESISLPGDAENCVCYSDPNCIISSDEEKFRIACKKIKR